MDQCWYVAQLKPSGDQIAQENLVRQGFGVFSPKYRRTCRRQGRFRVELRSLFPGYLFVRSEPNPARWRAIGGTLGVSRLVSFGGNGPSAVSGDVIDMLAEHCRTAGADPDAVKEGDLVRVVSGPFAGLVARVEKLPIRERIWVLLDFMGQHRRISLGTEEVLLERAS